MNKIFTTLVLLFSALNLIQAQDGYVKYTINTDYRKGIVKCFKDEILPFVKSGKANKINVIIGKDTVTDLSVPSKSFDTLQNPNKSYLSLKDSLVQVKKGGLVFINAALIPLADTVTLISEKGNQIVQLITQREVQLNQSDFGKTFRLIITNSPTIFYNSENLKQFIEPDQPQEKTERTPVETPRKGLAWWYYLLIILGIIGVILGVLKFLRGRKIKPNEVRFSGDSLTDFAKNYGGLDNLSSLNPGLIPTRNAWDKLKNKKEGQKLIAKLKKRKIIIKAENGTSFGNEEIDIFDKTSQTVNYKSPEPKDTFTQPFNQGNAESISHQISEVERNILNAISRGNDNSNVLNRLNNDISTLKAENNKFKNEKQNLDSTISELRMDKVNLEKTIGTINVEKNQKAIELNQLQEKIISVDYLSGYCDSVLVYLKLCDEVSSDAYNYFNRISKHNSQQANAISQLLIKFQNSINSFPVGNWTQILQDIKETGITNNLKIKNCFKQPVTTEDKIREFKRLLFSEVLVRYSSSILILAEAFRNLDRFQVSSDLAQDAQSIFKKHISELVNRIKPTGLENKYVPLFKNFEEFLGQIESVDSEKSFAYKGITGLEKGVIAEIVSYGVKTSFEETKTLIILA